MILTLLLLAGINRLGSQTASPDSAFSPFCLKIEWLANRYSPMQVEGKKGLSLVSSNYVELNSNVLKIKFPSAKAEQKLDLSGKNLLFTNQVSGADVLMPCGISLNDYFFLKSQRLLHQQLTDLIEKSAAEAKTAASTEKLELIGADIAGQRVSLQVSGNVNINGRLQNQKSSQVRTGFREGQSTTFLIDQKQQLSIEGKIGDRISILVDQDSERDFDFENALKIVYTGHEDDIVQKIEAGNIALSLPGTQFVTFSGKNNGLFGLKALMKLGPIDLTTIASTEKGKKEKLSVDGGAQTSTGFIKDYEYRRNQYFFLDKSYRDGFYKGFAENGGRFVFDPNYVVSDLEVYKSMNMETAGCVYGAAYVNPNDTTERADLKEKRIFKRLELGKDYYADLNLGYIRLAMQLQESEILGVSFQIVDRLGNTKKEFGQWKRGITDTSDIKLKLIKPQHMLPSHPCWDLEFKNVYFLGTTGINKEGFELSIVYNYGQNGDIDRDEIDGKTFLRKFGLDMMSKNGDPTPDDIIDMENNALINLQTGELWLPFLRPFQYKENDQTGERNPYLRPLYNCSAMYDSNRSDQADINEDSKFKLMYKYQNRSSSINLGPMVIENSEIVTLNNTQQTRGVDYTIDYFSGTLTLLTKDALNPDAKLDIKYEKNQFFQLDKKTILGAHAQYDFGENSYIGGTALYFSQSVIDEKVDIGYEPMQNFVWDLNAKLSRNMNFLTRAVDWLPLIQTNEKSQISFEGEIAQVLPNPNTISNDATGDPNGVGFIDDFEGSKRITSPPIMRRYWTLSSVPLDKTEPQRGFTFWFNPYGGVATRDIWPNKEVSARAQNNITEVLGFAMDPKWSINVADGVDDAKNAWGGITYYFPTSYFDQSKTKFIEIWVRGNSGQLHINLGHISEDQFPDGILNTEDKPEAGFMMGNGSLDLDKGEDTGLDGVPDEQETITTKIGTLGYGAPELENYNRDPKDPHSDNWSWKQGSVNYRNINGTEGNSKDESGRFPDTEDMNANSVVDLIDDYYTIDFNLDDKKDERYVAGRTEYENKIKTGWKLYRIPLTEFEKKSGGDVTWQTIRACRLWVDGFTKEDSLWIAKIEMVGNEWEEVGIAPSENDLFVRKPESFAVSVINSEDNPDTYVAPKGVQGEYDQINEIRVKEQSLVLWFDGQEGLQPGELCAAKKVLPEEASFITYKKMKLFINGRNLHTRNTIYQTDQATPLQFFIKFGRLDERYPLSYYEYRQIVYPGWDKRNKMEIDLDFITLLKSYDSEEEFPYNDQHPKRFRIYRNDKGEIEKRHYREVKDGKYTGVEVIIVGNAALSRVNRIDVGLKNQKYSLDDFSETNPYSRYDNTIYGEVWLDELRLSEVRRDAGTAYRSKASVNFADLASLDVSMDRRDADFHTVEQRPSLRTDGLKTAENFRAQGRISLDKFTPSSWGIKLPVSGSFSQNLGTPKYMPGQDILTGTAPPDSILDVSRQYGINTSFEKRTSDYWLMKYTLDQTKLGFSAQWANNSTNLIKESNSESYRANMSYRVPFGKENYLQIFKWMSSVPVLGNKLSETRLYYTPSNLDFAFDASNNKRNQISRGAASQVTNTHELGLNSQMNFSYKMFDNLNLKFSKDMKNNLDEYKNDIGQAIRKMNIGQPVNIRENYSASYSPKIFSWLTPNINYNSNYNWSEPMGSPTKSIDQLSSQNRISTSFNLNLSSILASFYSQAKSSAVKQPAGGRVPSRSRTGMDEDPQVEQMPTKGPKAGLNEPKNIKSLDLLTKYLKKLQTIQFSYSISQSVNNLGRIGTPGLAYRMGLSQDPGLDIIESEVGVGRDNITKTVDGSIRSGLNLFQNMATSFSYSQSMSQNNSMGQTGKNLTRDFFPMGINGKDGIPFPNWTFGWSNLEKYKPMNKLFKKLSLDHGFAGKEAIIWKNGKEMNSSYKIYFQPLVGLNMQFKNDITTNVRLTKGLTINNRENGTELVDEMNVSATVGYQKKGGFSIPLPFLKDKRLENSLNFSMTFDYSASQTRARARQSGKFAVQQLNNSWKIEPRINYSFTKTVTGGLFFQYGTSFNRHTGKRTTTNGGLNVNIAIRG